MTLVTRPSQSEEFARKSLRGLGRSMDVPILEAKIGAEVFDRFGNPIIDHQQYSHSFTRNMFNQIISTAGSIESHGTGFQNGDVSSKEPDGTIVTGNFSSGPAGFAVEGLNTRGFRADAAEVTKGIVVGTGTTAESFDDFNVESIIAEGTGVGQMNYTQMAVPTVSFSAPNLSVEWIRFINNNSAAQISVGEVVMFQLTTDFDGSPNQVLVSRDVLSSVLPVAATAQLKITYTVTLAYP